MEVKEAFRLIVNILVIGVYAVTTHFLRSGGPRLNTETVKILLPEEKPGGFASARKAKTRRSTKSTLSEQPTYASVLRVKAPRVNSSSSGVPHNIKRGLSNLDSASDTYRKPTFKPQFNSSSKSPPSTPDGELEECQRVPEKLKLEPRYRKNKPNFVPNSERSKSTPKSKSYSISKAQSETPVIKIEEYGGIQEQSGREPYHRARKPNLEKRLYVKKETKRELLTEDPYQAVYDRLWAKQYAQSQIEEDRKAALVDSLTNVVIGYSTGSFQPVTQRTLESTLIQRRRKAIINMIERALHSIQARRWAQT